MERRHVVELVPARVAARIVPHTVTAPAVVDGKFADVIPPVAHPFLSQDLFCKIRKVARIIGPVIAAIDQQHVELFPVIAKRFLFGKLNKLPDGAGALRAFCGRALRMGYVAADCALPCFTGHGTARSRFPGYSNRHAGNSPLPVPGIPGRDTPVRR